MLAASEKGAGQSASPPRDGWISDDGAARHVHIWPIWGWWNIWAWAAGFRCCMAWALGLPGGMPPMRAAAFICGPGPETPMWPTSWWGMPPAVVPGWLGLCAMPGAMGWPGGAPGCCCIAAGCGEKPGPMLAIISRAVDYPPGGRRPALLSVIACEVGDGRAALSKVENGRGSGSDDSDGHDDGDG